MCEKTPKELFRALLDRLPEDVSMSDIARELSFLVSVQRGLDEARRGEGITQEELEARLREWRMPSGRRRLADR